MSLSSLVSDLATRIGVEFKTVRSELATGLSGKQASAADLTAIAALTPSNDDVVQRKAGAWTNRTPGQLKADLAVTASDVGAYPKLTATVVKTSAYSVLNGEIATCDDSGGSFTITLPAATNGVVVGVRKYVSAANANTITVQRAGSDVIGGASATSVPVKLKDQTLVLHAVGGLWLPVWGFLDLAQLDGRFQPLDADLTTIAGLTATTDSFLQAKSSAWTTRTVAQVKTDLGVPTVASDIGAQPADADLTTIAGLTATTDSFMQAKAGAWAARTVAQVKSDLAIPSLPIAESDVTGLATDLANKQPIDSDLTAIAGLAPSNDDIIQRKSGLWVNRSIAQLKADLNIDAGDPFQSNYPYASWELLTASVHPDLTTSNFSPVKNTLYVCRIYVPANTVITGGAIFVNTAGATPGSTGASGFVLLSDTGTQLAINANDYTIFTTTGWRSKPFTSSYTTGSAGEFLRLGAVHTCTTTGTWLTAPGPASVTLRDTSRTSTTVRRAVSQASVTTMPASITPSTYGTALAALIPLFGVY